MNEHIKNRKMWVFDFDGTLIDTGDLIAGSFQHIITTFGLGLDARKVWKDTEGMTLIGAYKHLVPELDAEALATEHLRFQESNTHLVKVYPDVPLTLETLRAFGKQLSVLTNRTGNAESLLAHCGIAKHFELVMTAKTAPKPKPAPDGIQALLRHFGAHPDQAVIVGDTRHDITAGKTAGVATVVVVRDNNRAELESHRPDWVIDSLLELTQ